MIIGIDDTDSREGMCTTYLGALLMEELCAFGSPLGEPLLIRLNPTIPYKTRGNAAVALCFESDEPEKIIGHVVSRVSSMSRMECENTNPGVVFIREVDFKEAKPQLSEFFIRAVKDVISIDEARALAESLGLAFRAFKNGRGLIGALAACGAMLNQDWEHTYEFLTYRKDEACGTKRLVDNESLFGADSETYPETWDSVDRFNELVVCVPRSPDPVLYGIRGDTREAVEKAVAMVRSEEIERSCIYRTNQGTDMHLIRAGGVDDILEMHSYMLEGTVVSPAVTIRGGHSIFILEDDAGRTIDCAAFEPTKNFREVVRRLVPGDRVVVYGSVTEDTLNIEKICILSLADVSEERNPACPSCGKRMKSAGSGQGYRCRRCATSAAETELVPLERDLGPGFYEVPPCARRHLAKPLVRFRCPEFPVFPGR
ncbi:tRNA(Ile2) 2-agmatinylcytidine synthetase [Methanolobus chelungpuianus]|uniref:tRNA(Ile2) 2-agmatinylcytidine synthetase TiaS n=1 Tax=Methanolobus chelungpuianus TaxID=502115 RepID=A0AAE3HB78_9EURY|nr:tRNA(Ile2) 2-agmatinylcytidine synthetase [Methanolobus chelungpuianus]